MLQSGVERGQIDLQLIDIFLEFFFFSLGRHCSSVKFIEGETNDDGVEEHLVNCLDALLQQNFLFQFRYLFFMRGLQDTMIEPMLKRVVLPANPYEHPSKKHHLVLLLALFQVAQHRLRKGTDQQGENLLEGDHQ
jgi:hypothetical protein